MRKKYKPLLVKDDNESYHYKRKRIFDVPFRLLITAKSGAGKTNLLVNLICRNEFYNKDFDGENIFIVSPSLNNDDKIVKMIKFKEIPKCNLFSKYSDDILDALYSNIQDEYENDISEKKKPEHYLMIMDDVAYSGFLRKSKMVNKMYMNGRHINLSTIVIAQKFSDISTSIRENVTGAILFNCSNKQLELIANDYNYIPNGSRQDFIRMFRENVKEKYDYLIVNFSNNLHELYLDKDFEPIKYTVKKEKKNTK